MEVCLYVTFVPMWTEHRTLTFMTADITGAICSRALQPWQMVTCKHSCVQILKVQYQHKPWPIITIKVTEHSLNNVNITVRMHITSRIIQITFLQSLSPNILHVLLKFMIKHLLWNLCLEVMSTSKNVEVKCMSSTYNSFITTSD